VASSFSVNFLAIIGHIAIRRCSRKLYTPEVRQKQFQDFRQGASDARNLATLLDAEDPHLSR
jgi:hypothetical protein